MNTDGTRFFNPARANPQDITVFGQGKTKHLTTTKGGGWGNLVVFVSVIIITGSELIEPVSWVDRDGVIHQMRKLTGRMIDMEQQRVQGFFAAAFDSDTLIVNTQGDNICWSTMMTNTSASKSTGKLWPRISSLIIDISLLAQRQLPCQVKRP
jgi:hypothetical protein